MVISAVELHEVLLVWTSALAGKKFLHGDEVSMPDLLVFNEQHNYLSPTQLPNYSLHYTFTQVSMPDLLVFGVLRSIRGLRTFDEVMAHNPQLGAWYGAVEALSPSSQIIH